MNYKLPYGLSFIRCTVHCCGYGIVGPFYNPFILISNVVRNVLRNIGGWDISLVNSYYAFSHFDALFYFPFYPVAIQALFRKIDHSY